MITSPALQPDSVEVGPGPIWETSVKVHFCQGRPPYPFHIFIVTENDRDVYRVGH